MGGVKRIQCLSCSVRMEDSRLLVLMPTEGVVGGVQGWSVSGDGDDNVEGKKGDVEILRQDEGCRSV